MRKREHLIDFLTDADVQDYFYSKGKFYKAKVGDVNSTGTTGSGAHRILMKDMSDGSKLIIDPSQPAQYQAKVEPLYSKVQKDFGKASASDVTVLSVESIQLVD